MAAGFCFRWSCWTWLQFFSGLFQPEIQHFKTGTMSIPIGSSPSFLYLPTSFLNEARLPYHRKETCGYSHGIRAPPSRERIQHTLQSLNLAFSTTLRTTTLVTLWSYLAFCDMLMMPSRYFVGYCQDSAWISRHQLRRESLTIKASVAGMEAVQ